MQGKGKTNRALGIALIAVILAVTMLLNFMCLTYKKEITLFFRNTETATNLKEGTLTNEESFAQGQAMGLRAEEEGAVLLKNDGNALPLDSSVDKVNLFGVASYAPMYTNGGSSAVDTVYNGTFRDAFESCGYSINEALWNYYEENYVPKNGSKDFTFLELSVSDMEAKLGENLWSDAQAFSDTAVIVFARFGGEGSDEPMDMAEWGGDAGKHYLELQDVELELLEQVKAHFANVIVLVNSSHVMELGFLENRDGTAADPAAAGDIDAALWIGGIGSGAKAIPEILKGEVNPSGHLADTYAYDLTTAPSYYNFGNFEYSNFTNEEGGSADVISLGGVMTIEMLDESGGNKYIYYNEGIYTGYRWYETAAADGFLDYDATVQYPFGYGLSFTDFDWEVTGTELGNVGGQISVAVKVTNIGDRAGKDVVQLYYSAPYYPDEGIEKSSVMLGAFAKTDLLQPGESDEITLTLNMDDMASYDYQGAGCYVLSAGSYDLRLQTDSHNLKVNSDGTAVPSITYTVDSKVIYDDAHDGKRSTDEAAAVNQFDEIMLSGDGHYNTDEFPRLTRSNQFADFPTQRTPSGLEASERVTSLVLSESFGATQDKATLLAQECDPITTGAKNGITAQDMYGVAFDDVYWDMFLDQFTLDELVTYYQDCGWSSPAVASCGIDYAQEIDGPTGINSINSQGEYTASNYPSEPVMAATWNVELIRELGSAYGAEALACGVSGLYAPATNLHRSPFGGRSGEYFSEDPLLAGKMAANEVEGIQSQGIYVFLKHFAVNEQESGRSGALTWCDEQALREIYFRPWEIACKEVSGEGLNEIGLTGIMGSYNRLGTAWTSTCSELMVNILREEWGFKGMLNTDGLHGFNYELGDYALLGGTTMCLSQGNISSELKNSAYGQQLLREAAHIHAYIYCNSASLTAYTDMTPYWMAALVAVDILAAAGVIVIAAKIVYPACKKKKILVVE